MPTFLSCLHEHNLIGNVSEANCWRESRHSGRNTDRRDCKTPLLSLLLLRNLRLQRLIDVCALSFRLMKHTHPDVCTCMVAEHTSVRCICVLAAMVSILQEQSTANLAVRTRHHMEGFAADHSRCQEPRDRHRRFGVLVNFKGEEHRYLIVRRSCWRT